MRQISRILNDLNIDALTPKDINENELVIQHNHLVEARYRLSLQEKRVILWLLTQISVRDEDFKLLDVLTHLKEGDS